MPWNWELAGWPQFSYDPNPISELEKKFLLGVGKAFGYLKTIDKQDYTHFIVEILSLEGLESSKIEGEILDRESLQSSIKRHFGMDTTPERGTEKETVAKLLCPEKSMILKPFASGSIAATVDATRPTPCGLGEENGRKGPQKDDFSGRMSFAIASKESAMAELLCNVYESFDKPLTHEMLWKWHSMLFNESSSITDRGQYRTHADPMQIVSNRYGSQIVFFEAPPSSRVFEEMTTFIKWFNTSKGSGPILVRAALAHVYFESIHPFEDGNGRIGRILVEKILSQGVGQPILIAVSKLLEKRKKEYYSALEKCNRTLEIQHWIEFFSSVILQAHEESLNLLYFLIEKSKILTELSGEINPRQMKALLRMFEEGPNGFKGGLSAENYITITKTTRPTATRDLTDLVEKGALTKTGELRHTRYHLNLKNNRF